MKIITPNFLEENSEAYSPNKENNLYENRDTVRIFVLDGDRKIGLIKPDNSEIYFPPGGGVEVGENIGEAVIREVAEELGVSCEFKKDLGILEHYHEKWMKHFLIHHVYATSNKKVVEIDYEEYDTNLERTWMNIEDYQVVLRKYLTKKPDDVWAKAVLYFINELVDELRP